MCNVLFKNSIPDDGANIKEIWHIQQKSVCHRRTCLSNTDLFWHKNDYQAFLFSFTRLILVQFTKTRKWPHTLAQDYLHDLISRAAPELILAQARSILPNNAWAALEIIKRSGKMSYKQNLPCLMKKNAIVVGCAMSLACRVTWQTLILNLQRECAEKGWYWIVLY